MFAEIVEELMATDPDVSQRKMFGHDCLMVNGKGFAIDYQGDMVFKLGSEALESARDLPGAQAFDPMQMRPMKQWLQVPADQNHAWLELAQMARDFASSLPGKSGAKQ